MEKIKIRKARKEDLKEIARILMKESVREPYNEKYNMRIALKEVTGFLKGEFYVAVDKNEAIGFIAAGIVPNDKEKAYINELWLKPDYQRNGTGKALVAFVESLYKKRKIKIIRLVAKKKAGAFKFYKKLKYKEYKELVFMEKRL